MKKIIISIAMIAAVGAIVVGATTAYFSDTETSTGNTFTAGSIDLKIDNESYVTNPETGYLMYSDDTSWELGDLDGELFFDFADLKPGDMGEDTVSIRVDNNDAWVCANFAITADDDVTCTEPEEGDDPTCDEPNEDDFDGELADALEFIFWVDDGDNVLEGDEGILLEGSADDLFDGTTFPIADTNFSIAGQGQEGWLPLEGSHDYYIAKAWCFGDLTTDPLEQDGLDEWGPLSRLDLGIYCDGSLVDNASQSDSVMGDVSFTAVQARNNEDFVCPQPAD